MTDEKTNICFLTRRPVFPICGGVERVTATLAEAFEEQGFSCVFLSMKKNSETVPKNKIADVIPKKNGARFFEIFLREHKIGVLIWQNGGSHFLPFPQVLKKLGVCVISCSHGQPDYYWHSATSKARGFDSLAIHGLKNRLKLAWKLFWLDFFHRRAIRFNAKNSDAYVLLSENYLPDLKRFFPEGKIPCRVLGIGNINSFPAQTVDFSAKKKELLFVGRLEFSHKRPDYLLRIWAKLESAFPQWNLRFIGNGGDAEKLKKLARTLGLKRAFFEGFKNPENYYRDASIFCMTSAHEGFPMALGEAAAFGCVPVAFDSFAAVHDLVSDGENGAIVPAFDLEKYAETLAKLMRDDALRERLARNARRNSDNFSKEKIVARWKNLLTE